jgi:hypothetical protein
MDHASKPINIFQVKKKGFKKEKDCYMKKGIQI